MALGDGAGHAKPAHRSTGAASQAPSNKPPRPGNPAASVRRDGPDDQRSGSKFLEAMKNPNWRDRRIDGTSSSSSGTEPAGPETSSLQRTMARARHWLASSCADAAKIEPDNIGNRKISASDRQFDVRHTLDGAACHGGCLAVPERPGGAFETKGLCGMMRRLNVDASPSREDGLHVIEITPHIATGRDKSSDDSDSPGQSPVIAEIQLIQVLPTETGQGPSHCHSYQLAPTLYLRGHQGELRSSSGTDQSTDRSTRGSTSDDFEAVVKSGSGQDKGPVDDARCPASDGQTSSLNAKNIAFQKMLKKLKIRTAESGSSREDGESGHGAGSGPDPVAEEPAGNARADQSPTVGLDFFVRRDKTASDHAVSYRPSTTSSRRAEGSKDSDYASDKLNPKAREFLSFRPDESGGAEKGKQRGFQASSCESLNDGGSPTDMWAGVGFEARDQAAPYEPVPVVYGTAPQYADIRSLMPIPPGFGLANVLVPAVNAVTGPPQMGTFARQPPLAPAWLGGASMLPRPSMSGSSPYHIAGSAFQSLPARFHTPAPAVPAHPLPTSATQASAFGRPAPVPKPKVPNAWDQQAYEAYIEQRKAMEPGYAMECRLRQQRRARRTPDAK